MMRDAAVLVIGGGLAGLTCALKLSARGLDVVLVEARSVVGGRTSSWLQDGMHVESGLHRVLGFYRHFPAMLAEAGIALDDIVYWEDEIEIRLPEGRGAAVLGTAPLYRPAETLGGIGNLLQVMGIADLASLPGFFTTGLHEYFWNPASLDRWTVADRARTCGVTETAIAHLLVPLTSGVLFLPPERYSAYAFFGLLGPYLPYLHTLRLGAFVGGMTEVMADPIAAAIERNGGVVRTNAPVERLIVRDGAVVGAELRGGERLFSSHVVLATSLGRAQHLLERPFGRDPWFEPMLSLPSMPAVTLQVELDAPSMSVDRTTFAPDTVLGSFAEQSRTTFSESAGRLSIILTPPDQFLDMDAARILDIACRDADRLGLRVCSHVTRYSVVRLPEDFYSLVPGAEPLRPPQQTPVPGLTLAGDYTQQPYLTTMEGAVASGTLASLAVQSALQ